MVVRFLGSLLAASLLVACGRTPSIDHLPLDHQAYVWQRVWTPQVTSAIKSAPSQVKTFRLLVAEFDPAGQWQEFRMGRPDRLQSDGTLAIRLKEAVAVIRISGQRAIENPLLEKQLATWIAAQRPKDWAGLEIDYDCPTSRLPEYGRMLSRLRGKLPTDWQLGITALPAWIGNNALPRVLEAVDGSVLQVHSVMRPEFGLFQAGLAVRWANEYSRGSPHRFRLALPTYGSRVVWRRDGTVLDVQSEDPESVGERAEAITEEWMARPAEVARALAELQRRRPARLAGFIWFRLPVEGDRRNWSLSTWRDVMQGNPLRAEWTMEIRPTREGVRWLELANTGPTDGAFADDIRQAGNCLAVDAQRPFQLERTDGDVHWRAPNPTWIRSGERLRIGWTRCPEDVVMAPESATKNEQPDDRKETGS